MHALAEPCGCAIAPQHTIASDPDTLADAVADVAEKLAKAETGVILAGYLLHRLRLTAEAQKLVGTWGMPYATMSLHQKNTVRADLLDDIYASSDLSVILPKYRFPKKEIEPRHAYQLVHDSRATTGDDREAGLAQKRGQPGGLRVKRVIGGNAGRTEDGHGRADVPEFLEAVHDLGHAIPADGAIAQGRRRHPAIAAHIDGPGHVGSRRRPQGPTIGREGPHIPGGAEHEAPRIRRDGQTEGGLEILQRQRLSVEARGTSPLPARHRNAGGLGARGVQVGRGGGQQPQITARQGETVQAPFGSAGHGSS